MEKSRRIILFLGEGKKQRESKLGAMLISLSLSMIFLESSYSLPHKTHLKECVMQLWLVIIERWQTITKRIYRKRMKNVFLRGGDVSWEKSNDFLRAA